MSRQEFPGFNACLGMMRDRDPQVMEDGFHWLRSHVAEFVPGLLAAFRDEMDRGVKCWLLELIGDSRDARALDLLVEQLRSEDESLRQWAETGLKTLDSRESRTVLFEWKNSLR
jgi:hypothetical protein